MKKLKSKNNPTHFEEIKSQDELFKEYKESLAAIQNIKEKYLESKRLKVFHYNEWQKYVILEKEDLAEVLKTIPKRF